MSTHRQLEDIVMKFYSEFSLFNQRKYMEFSSEKVIFVEVQLCEFSASVDW